jgi:hypothetical protein
LFSAEDRNTRLEESSATVQNPEFICIIPTIELLSDAESALAMFNSHDWEIEKVEPQGDMNIIFQIHCKNCGLNRISIISDILDSAKRANEYRQGLKPVLE